MLNNYDTITFVGDGFDIHKEILGNHASINDIHIHATNIGIAAYNKYIQGIRFTPDSVQPEYLKPSQAERLKQ